MRTFIAIELPDAVRERLSGLIERLRESGAALGWVKPESMHLTLRFLGDLETESVDRLCEFLDTAYRDATSFPLAVRGLGAFPNIKRPSVLWAGVEAGDALLRAQDAAEQAARTIGLPAESRAFHPHLTLARVKNAAEIRKIVPYWEREQGFEAGSFEAKGVTLFSSTLTPRGALYRPIQEFRFQ